MKEDKISTETDRGRRFSGVAVLTASMIAVKLIGAAFKIPMLKYVGIEGMGYFNAAYHFYSLLITISSAGLPVALSILISRSLSRNDFGAARSEFVTAVRVFCSLGGLFSVLMFLFSERIAYSLGIPNTRYCLCAVSPAVLFATFSGAVRGYFQGHSVMTPTAVSQIIESLGKLVFGLGFAVCATHLEKPPYEVAAAAIFGTALGMLFSSVYLYIEKYRYDKRLFRTRERPICRAAPHSYRILIKTAFPVTLSAAVLSLTSLLDTLVIPSSLVRSGIDQMTSLNLYSTYTSLALPLFALPAAFVTPITLVLAPRAAAEDEIGGCEENVRMFSSSLRLSAFITLPCALGMAVFSQPILDVVFSEESSAVRIGARLLTVLSVSVFFSGLLTVSNSMLQSCKKQKLPVISLALGAAVKLISGMILVSMPSINIYGAPISTFLCTLTAVTLNFVYLESALKIKVSSLSVFLRPMLSASISVLFAIPVYRCTASAVGITISLLITVPITAVLYLALSLRWGALLREDIYMFPKGEKIFRLLQRIKLVK